jgi:dephospho-CoA kinase
MKIIGITGGIGSGKSTVCNIFNILGTPVYQSDERAKFLMQNDTILKHQIIHEFGKESYANDTLNRAHLATIVFNSKKQTEKINTLVHPVVARDFLSWYESQTSNYVLKEAALMIESGAYKSLNHMIGVSAPIDIRIKRTMKRDAFRTEAEIRSIIDKQVSEEERIALSDHIIINDGTSLLIPEVIKLHEKFSS